MNLSERNLRDSDILKYFEYKYDVPKDPRIDNQAYYPLYDKIQNPDIRYHELYGGRGSAKSYEIGKLPVVLLSCLDFCRCIGIREIFNTVRGSLYQEIMDYMEEWSLQQYFKCTVVPMKITHLETNNFMLFAGMDKPYSIKSTKDLTHAIIEEALQLKSREGLDKVDKSIRTPKSHCHKIIMAYNTDNPDHFIYADKHNPETLIEFKVKLTQFIHTTHLDNKYLPNTYRQLLESDKDTNPEIYKADALGLWSKVKLSGLFYFNFEKFYTIIEDELKDRVYSRTKPLYLKWDFNVEPYITLTISCMNYLEASHTIEFCTIDEICIPDNLDPAVTCIEFIKRYHRHLGSVFIMGDRSGHSRKTSGVTDYSTIKLCLAKTPKGYGAKKSGIYEDPYPEYEDYNCQWKLIDRTNRSQNQNLDARQIFFSRLHSGKMFVLPASASGGTKNTRGQHRPLSVQYANAKIVQKVGSNCFETIKDYYEVQTDPIKGGKSTRDPKRTHTSDSLDYGHATVFEAEFNMVLAELKNNLRG